MDAGAVAGLVAIGGGVISGLIDRTVVRVRLDRKATSISLLIVIGVRADGPKGAAGGSRGWAGRRPNRLVFGADALAEHQHQRVGVSGWFSIEVSPRSLSSSRCFATKSLTRRRMGRVEPSL
jgi:hypothetical protein